MCHELNGSKTISLGEIMGEKAGEAAHEIIGDGPVETIGEEGSGEFVAGDVGEGEAEYA